MDIREIDLGPEDSGYPLGDVPDMQTTPRVELRGFGGKYDLEMVDADIQLPTRKWCVYIAGEYVGELDRVEIRLGRKVGVVSARD